VRIATIRGMSGGFHIDKLSDKFGQFTLVLKCSCGAEWYASRLILLARRARKLMTREPLPSGLVFRRPQNQLSAEGISLDEGACRGCGQRIHRNPATLVTPWPFDTCISICT
jgi:hypothetical protein